MPDPNQSIEPLEHEIARLAEEYHQAKQNGAAVSIDWYLDQHPQLATDLREALEAIDLLGEEVPSAIPQVLGDFQLHREIGRGGMGCVYQATQLSLSRPVALKVLKLSSDQSLEAELFLQEAKTVAALRHEHIVPVYTVGRVNDWLYFAMALIDVDATDHFGSSSGQLRSRADQRRRRRQVASWAAEIAETLDYAHHHGIIHGDIKPSNLLIDKDQRIWLSDFGLARQVQDAAINPSLVYRGTPKYMSPEQAGAITAPVDHRTDIYSLGVTIVQWLTGQSLVGGNNPAESLARLQQNSLEELDVLLRGYDRDWLAVLQKCTARHPKDRYESAADLSTDLRALAEHQPVAARPQPAIVRSARSVLSGKNFATTTLLSVIATIVFILGSGAVWQIYRSLAFVRVHFHSASGDWLSVTALDESKRKVGEFVVPHDEVRLPSSTLQLDVSASQKLSYKRTIAAGDSPSAGGLNTYKLDAPQSHRWKLENVAWYQVLTLGGSSMPQTTCLVLRDAGLSLVEVTTGKVLWDFHDPETIAWGNSVRGCPSTFQPDRCVVVPDATGNQCAEIVLAHPHRPELLCLDGSTGEQLWRSNLAGSTGLQAVDADNLCPIVLQCSPEIGLNVIVASQLPATSALDDRWLMNVDPVTGKVRWTSKARKNVGASMSPPIVTFPLRLQWGEVEKRPSDYSFRETFYYFDDYWRMRPNFGASNVYDSNIRLGTDRPFLAGKSVDGGLHWIDRDEVRIFNINNGEQDVWKLPATSLCDPHFLRSSESQSLVVIADAAQPQGALFTAWDTNTRQVVWKRVLSYDINGLPQSYLSPKSELPMSVDLNGDGIHEWLASSYTPVPRTLGSMTPPFGALMAHSGGSGDELWPQPFHLPSMDGKIERCVTVSDLDGDGWKDLLLGSRFQGGGVSEGVGCFVDLVSGQTGKRIWHSQVRTESTASTLAPNELVDLRVIEDQRLIAVVSYCGVKDYGIENARPYSTTFLSLESGAEEAFARGVRAGHFESQIWLEHRLIDESGSGGYRPRPGELLGWDYPASLDRADKESNLWRIEDYVLSACADVNGDGYPEVIGHRLDGQNSEYAIFDGLTGTKGWKKSFDPQLSVVWLELMGDADRDGKHDFGLLVLTQFQVGNKAPSSDTLHIISGATGKPIWKHTCSTAGTVTYLDHDFRASGELPLVIYQHTASKQVSCVDLHARKVAWTRDDFDANISTFISRPAYKESSKNWFCIAQSSDDCTAHFIDRETGLSINQIQLGKRLRDWQQYSLHVVEPQWIQWDGRDLWAIQTITEYSTSPAQSPDAGSLETVTNPEADVGNDQRGYRADLWLVDEAANLVAHWDGGVSQPPAAAMAQSAIFSPRPVKTTSGQERLAVSMGTDQFVGFQLLKWDASSPPSLVVDEIIRLPIGRNSTVSLILPMDCDDDGATDYITVSDGSIECTTASGQRLWQRPALPESTNFCSAVERTDRKYLCFQSPPFYEQHFLYLDARTGRECPLPPDETEDAAWNAMKTKHASLIYISSGADAHFIAAKRRPGMSKASQTLTHTDPRYVRLLPWVVFGKSMMAEWGRLEQGVSWWRILKLATCVFLLPIVAVWTCVGRRFTVRNLLFIATAVAIALSIYLADRSAFPNQLLNTGTTSALLVTFEFLFQALLILLPLSEMVRTDWRRKLAWGLYVVFLLATPVFTLLSNPVGIIPTVYSLEKCWYLLWLTLFPTGVAIVVMHAVRLFIKSVLALGRRVRQTSSKGPTNHEQVPKIVGESHGP